MYFAVEYLRRALQSVATDRLKVRGEDQLFSYKGQILERQYVANAAAGVNILTFTTVPAGEIWVVTASTAYNQTSASGAVVFEIYDGSLEYRLGRVASIVQYELADWNGKVYLKAGDRIRIQMAGCTLNDDIYGHVFGHKMTLEV